MTTTTKLNGFTRLNGSTYTCTACGRTTRNTGAQSVGSTLCPQCYEIAGFECDWQDDREIDEYESDVVELLNRIIDRGGRIGAWREFVTSAFPRLADMF